MTNETRERVIEEQQRDLAELNGDALNTKYDPRCEQCDDGNAHTKSEHEHELQQFFARDFISDIDWQ